MQLLIMLANHPADVKVLRNELINNGLMEYVAIPWDNHSNGSKEDVSAWTVNLALWFVHILAGNNFEVSWSYVDLTAETLVLSQPDVDSEQSPLASKNVQDPGDARDKQDEEDERSETSAESDTTNIRTPLNAKRKRNTDDEEEEEEGFHLSFSKRQNI
jgi:cytoskeletal protein RodZ